MASQVNALVFVLVAVATLLHTSLAAPTTHTSLAAPTAPAPVTYTVGDSMGWTMPSGGAASYQAWASNKTFKVGDILVFNFTRNEHNVAEVTEENFVSCDGASPMGIYSDPPVSLSPKKDGQYYYICTVPGHCAAGMKLHIEVKSVIPTSPPLPSDKYPPGLIPGEVPHSAATSLEGAAALFGTLLSVIAAAFSF